MTKLLSVLLATQIPLIQAWAPVQTLPYSKLPKTLEFAEMAWFLPKVEELNGPRSLSEESQHRMLPWTHQQHSTVRTDDSYFFDGYSGAATEWPSHQAFAHSQKSRTSLEMTPKTDAMDALDYYYDDTGVHPSKKNNINTLTT